MKPFVTLGVLLINACAYVPTEKINLKSSVMAKEVINSPETGTFAPKNVTNEFSIDDPIINVFATVSWDNVNSGAGVKEIRWEWYTDDRLVSKINAKFIFHTTPFSILGNIPTHILGKGNHSVKFYIENKEFSSNGFIVK